VHHVVGGSTKVYGASLPRFREQDFAAVEHMEGTSPAWPFSYAELEPYYHDGGDGFPLGAMQLIGKVQGVMMKSAAPRLVPRPLLNRLARRGVEWLIMAEDVSTSP
jgi:choline dehydrogenase-like flavoprotein